MFRRWILGIVLAGLSAGFAARSEAQDPETFGVGASVSAVNAVDHEFHLDEFDTRDWNAWAQYQLQTSIVLRGTVGSLKVRGHNGGQTASLTDGTDTTLPDLRDRVRYGLISASYDFREAGWTTGVIVGIGAYGIDPEPADVSVESFRDKKETVWGFHLGLDGDVRIWKGISVIGRLMLHLPQTKPQRRILTAGAGLLYRF